MRLSRWLQDFPLDFRSAHHISVIVARLPTRVDTMDWVVEGRWGEQHDTLQLMISSGEHSQRRIFPAQRNRQDLVIPTGAWLRGVRGASAPGRQGWGVGGRQNE